jgi:large subunit ribosomal protein L32
MAVPKRKQSHSRTAKRRANHSISAPALNACPTCGAPRLPHRVCEQCGTYRGRQVRTPRAQEHEHEHGGERS